MNDFFIVEHDAFPCPGYFLSSSSEENFALCSSVLLMNIIVLFDTENMVVGSLLKFLAVRSNLWLACGCRNLIK